MDFSFSYFADDSCPDPDRCQSLIENARFADPRGFDVSWTSERHSYAAGGPYLNLAMTGVAVAAVIDGIAGWAGSVALYHPARSY